MAQRKAKANQMVLGHVPNAVPILNQIYKSWDIHGGCDPQNKCHQVHKIKCLVDTETHNQKQQPNCIVRGWAKQVDFQSCTACPVTMLAVIK